MQKLSIELFLMIALTGCFQNKIKFNDYIASIKDFQYDMNREFSDVKTSPLMEEDLKEFKALVFFPIDSTYRVNASFKLDTNPVLFEMPTTTDRLPLYKTYGEATFELNGEQLTLHIYQNQELIKKPGYRNHLFIPFTDATNGVESYGGGRYIDIEVPYGDKVIIDFNKSYNPYCAYNNQYSCPIPPKENDLPIAIYAGIKAFENH